MSGKEEMVDTKEVNLKYRLVKIPKQNFDNEIDVEVQEETKQELKDLFDVFAKEGKIWPKALRRDLLAIGFHKSSPRIYEVIEKLCFFHDYPEVQVDFEEFITFITKELSNHTERKGLSHIFKSIMDKESVSFVNKSTERNNTSKILRNSTRSRR